MFCKVTFWIQKVKQILKILKQPIPLPYWVHFKLLLLLKIRQSTLSTQLTKNLFKSIYIGLYVLCKTLHWTIIELYNKSHVLEPALVPYVLRANGKQFVYRWLLVIFPLYVKTYIKKHIQSDGNNTNVDGRQFMLLIVHL